jgi:Flp pilus assembly secretin CpaC
VQTVHGDFLFLFYLVKLLNKTTEKKYMIRRFITLFFTLLIFTSMSMAQEKPPSVQTASTAPHSNQAQSTSLIRTSNQRQIVYEARMIRVRSCDIKNIDIVWDNATADASANTSLKETMPLGRIGHMTSTTNASLDALYKSRKAILLARPNLSAFEGMEASAFIGDEIKYIAALEETPEGTKPYIETAQVGLTLKVNSKYNNNGTLTLSIHPEISTVEGYIHIDKMMYPTISRVFCDTQIKVRENETIVLRGLQESKDTIVAEKKKTKKKEEDSQVLVFVTARVQKN